MSRGRIFRPKAGEINRSLIDRATPTSSQLLDELFETKSRRVEAELKLAGA